MPTNSSRLERIKNFKIGTIDKYLIREVASPFLGGIIFFTFVFLMFQALRLADFFIIHGVSLAILGQIVLFMGMSFLPMVLPLAFLIAILLAFGRLSSESELVAMKSSGFSLSRISLPVFAVSIIVVVLTLGLNLDWVPWSGRQFRTLIMKISNTKAVSSIKEGTFTSGFFDLLIYADHANSRTNRMERIFIYDEREPKNPLIVVAKEGRVVPVKTKQALAMTAVLSLNDGNIHRNDIESETYQRINFKEYNLYLNIPEPDNEDGNRPKFLSYRAILDKLRGTTLNPHERIDLQTELWRRYSYAISPICFVLLGIGFGTVRTRSVKAGASGLALLVILVYWGLQILGTSLAFKGFSAFLSMQMPNFVILLLGAYSFKKSSW